MEFTDFSILSFLKDRKERVFSLTDSKGSATRLEIDLTDYYKI